MPGPDRRCLALLVALAGWLAAATSASAVVLAPNVSKSFGAKSIPLGGSTSQTIAISNPNPTTGLTSVSFTDTLPAGLVVATPSGASTDCSGSVGATAGAGTISLSSSSIAPRAGCSVTVDVKGIAAGDQADTVTVGSDEGSSAPSTAHLLVVAPPVAFADFEANGVPYEWLDVGRTYQTVFGVQNPTSGTGLSGIDFSATLSPGVVVADPPGIVGGCPNGTISATPGGHAVMLSGASLADPAVDSQGSSCFFYVSVTATAEGVQSVDTGPVSSTEGGVGAGGSGSISVVPSGPRLYWTGSAPPGGSGFVSFAPLDASAGATLHHGGVSHLETGIAIDAASDTVYSVDIGPPNTIRHMRLDDTGAGGFQPLYGAEEAIAFDGASDRLYWAAFPSGLTFSAPDGSGATQLPVTGATSPGAFGMALDTVHGRVYWTPSNGTINKLAYAALDGSGAHDLTISGASVDVPTGIAVDTAVGRIYWANAGNNTIASANLDGSDAHDIAITGATVDAPQSLALDPVGGRMYWVNGGANGYGDESIASARLDGTAGESFAPPGGPIYGAQFLALLYPPAGAGSPAVSGARVVGSTMSCSPGAWAPDLPGAQLYRAPRDFAYQWTLGGADISSATASTYAPQAPGSYGCRVTASNAAGVASQASDPVAVAAATPPPPAASVARLDALRESHAVFRVGAAPTPLSGATAATAHPRGTTFSFILDQPASVTIAIARLLPGRRVGRQCRAPSQRLRHRPRCTRTQRVGALVRTARTGSNHVAFSGRLGRRALRLGRYQASFTASDTAGVSQVKRLGFRVVKR